MSAVIRRRLEALKAAGDGNAPRVWGVGFEHLPPMTTGEVRRMLRAIQDEGSGRLPIVKRAAMYASGEAVSTTTVPIRLQ